MNAPVAAFDGTIAADLLAILGPDGIAQLMASFANELRSRPPHIAALCDAADVAGARFEAHYLKGAALALGARPIADACAAIEQAADDDLPEAIRTLLHRAELTVAAIG